MSIPVVINGTDYNLPTQGQSPPWGDDLTNIILALIDSAANVNGPGDILKTTFLLANNQSSAANVTGLAFDLSQIRAAIVQYSVYRSTDSNEESETGTMYVTYSSLNSAWSLVIAGDVLNSTMVFTITSLGQIQYTSGNLAGANYTGRIIFAASAFVQ